MYNLGDTITHSVFGRGEIIYIDEGKDLNGNIIKYYDVHFDTDEKYKIRTFTEESLKKFLI